MKIPEVKRPSKEVLTKVHSLKGKKGMLAMIEPETAEWFLGKTTLEAPKKANKKYSDKIFYCVRIDLPVAHGHKGGIINGTRLSLIWRMHTDYKEEFS